MANHNAAKTPYRALTLAELNSGITDTQPRPVKPNITAASCTKPLQPALRIAEMFNEIQNNKRFTSARKVARNNTNQMNQKYLSTSKKTINHRRTECYPGLSKHSKVLFKPDSVKSPIDKLKRLNADTRKPLLPIKTINEVSEKPNTRSKAKASLCFMENQDMRKSVLPEKSTNNSFNAPKNERNIVPKPVNAFTEYRTIRESLNSSCDESPIKINDIEKSIIEHNEINAHKSLSDSICDVLERIDLNSSNEPVLKCLREISEKLNKGLEKISIVSKLITEISDSYKTIIEPLTKVINFLSEEQKTKENINSQNILGENFNTVQSKLAPEVVSPKTNLTKTMDKVIVSPKCKIQHKNKGYDLRRTVLLSKLNNQINPIKNKLPPINKSLETKSHTTSPKGNRTRRMNDSKNDENSPPKNASKENNITTPENKKSVLMYTTLKKNMSFLKTPVGKNRGKHHSSLHFETPNTRSRSITSTNIQNQLERLFDDPVI